MTKPLLLLALLLMAPFSAHANHFAVHVPGSKQPYICADCSLRLPYPDDKTAAIISAWRTGEAPFVGRVSQNGPELKLDPGDVVNVCNTCGCATYTVDDSGALGAGAYSADISYPSYGPPIRKCPASMDPKA
jgi:hypothetical protein